ncbi:MAG: class A beta-lactamase [Caulobacteraceae bacterium]
MSFRDLDRRAALAGFSAALLASCRAGPPPLAQGPARLDTDRLAAGFAPLAARAKPGSFGFGVSLMDGGTAWVSDAKARFPLQSVFKAFLAAATLALVDSGQIKLSEPVTLTEQDLAPGASAIIDAWTGRPITLPFIDLVALAVQNSDNVAADAVMKRIGGPAAVTAWLRGKGIADISVDRYETQLQPEALGMGPFQPAWINKKAWNAALDAVPAEARETATARYLSDPRDTATLPAALQFLTRLAAGNLLSAASTRLLLRLMTDTPTGFHRLRAGLPADASLAHKTGTSYTVLGITAATNDIGIATLANGRRFAMTAFLAGSTGAEADRDALIADAARLAVSCVA